MLWKMRIKLHLKLKKIKAEETNIGIAIEAMDGMG